MSKVCKKHRENPARIYSQCIGCEIENLNQCIKEQEDLLKWFRERQGWIRVKDRLPDDDTQVLAVDRYGDQEVVLFVDGYFQPDYIGEVTHWMPLPEPPRR